MQLWKLRFGQKRQDGFGVPADQGGRAGACAEEALDPLLLVGVEAMDPAVTHE